MATILAALTITALLLTILSRVLLFARLSKTATGPTPEDPISVLKPLKGYEDGLAANLIALAEQDHPAFEIICCAADANDPALVVARHVRDCYPDVRFRVVSGAPDLGLNPKVSNLARLFQEARHDLVLISDSNVRPPPHYLSTMVREMKARDAQLVHSPLAGCGGTSLGGVFEDLQLGAWVVSAVALASELLRHPCVIGKSMLFSKAMFEALGGLHEVKDLLAEDYEIGRMFDRAGMRVVLCPLPLPVRSGRRSLGEFTGRHLRWAQMRRRIEPMSFLAEPLLQPLLLALFWLAAAPGPGPMWAIAISLFVDAVTLERLRDEWPRTLELTLMPLKELVVAAIWLVASVRTTVEWRGRRFRIEPGGHLSAHPALAPATPELATETES